MKMDNITVKAEVSGLVQGVSFRASTQHRANDLGVNGYAHNLADGRVEVLMSGDRKKIAELISWLHDGPMFAKVQGVECFEIPFEECIGFTTG